jgi:hypothetical protein
MAASAFGSLVLVVSGVLAEGAAPVPNPGCAPNAIPTGQSNPPGSESEPMAPIWCFTLAAQGAPTRITGANDWVDTFQGVTQMGQFNDGDLDYRVFDSVQNGGTAKTLHFTNNNHWMDDNAGGFQGGTMLRPNRSFRFENGKLVVEADVAAGISGYRDGGDVAWPEIDISTADTPNGHSITDGLYAYGRFGGFDTFGCRLHAAPALICAYEAARGGATGLDQPPCFEFSPARLIEISGFENCGNVHFGGDPGFGAPAGYFRTCSSPSQVPDMMCRDRFRLELSQDGLVAYVNGQRYFEDTGWPTRNQLPAGIANGSTPVYVYMSDWEDRPNQPAYRFHWQRIAVNSHNADGTSMGPSAAPSFCLGQSHNTCDMPATPAVPETSVVRTPDDFPPPAVTSNQAPPPSDMEPASPTDSDSAAAPPAPAAAAAAVAAPAEGDPIVGDARVLQWRDSNPDGTAEAFHFVAARSDTATRLQVYVDGSNRAQRIVVGLYDSTDSQHPGQLLASGVLTSPAGDAWNGTDISPVTLAGGTSYWLAVLGPAGDGQISLRDVNEGGAKSETSRQTNLSQLPDVWSSGQAYGSSPISAYASGAR